MVGVLSSPRFQFINHCFKYIYRPFKEHYNTFFLNFKYFFLIFLFFPSLLFAQPIEDITSAPLEVTEPSGSPSVYPWRLVFPTGSVSDEQTGTNISFTAPLNSIYLLLSGSNANQNINIGNYDFKALSFSIGANTLTTSEWAYLDGQDQAIKTTSSPTFGGLTLTLPANGSIVIDAATTDNTVSNLIDLNLDADAVGNQHAFDLNTVIMDDSPKSGAAITTGIYNSLTDTRGISSGSGGGLYGIDINVTKNGTDTFASEYTIYGLYAAVSNSSGGDLGTRNTWAGRFRATGTTNGTSTVGGVYIDPSSGGDTNIGLCFDCDGTWSSSTVASGIQFGTDANAVTFYRSANDTLKTDDAFIASTLQSTIATGTAPFTIASTTLNTNLNADMLDDKHTGTSGNVIGLLDGNNVYSGTARFTGSSLEIPNGASPTVDAQGEIAQDTTDDQIVYGSTPRILAYQQRACFVIEALAAADDNYTCWIPNQAVTITSVGCRYEGTGTTVAQMSLEDASGNAMTHTTPTCITSTNNATYQSVTAAGGLAAGEALRFDVDNAVSPETDTYSLCWTYTIDRQ